MTVGLDLFVTLFFSFEWFIFEAVQNHESDLRTVFFFNLRFILYNQGICRPNCPPQNRLKQ